MASPDRQFLPEGLADMPPGPRLGVVLAGVNPARLTADDAETLMRAWYRQMSYDQALFMEAMVQFGLCRPAPHGVVAHDADPSPSASDEVRVSLRWTRRAAERQYYLALDMQRRLPGVHEALRAGRIDLPRARVLTEWTQELTFEQATRICDRLLPEAPSKTTGELVNLIKQLAVAVDPEWAARRYQEAVRTRRVVGYRTADGTANLSGLDLPLDQAAAACANVTGLAGRVKQAGDSRPIDQIRADLFLGLLDGTFTGMTDDQITAHLLTTADDHGRPGGRPAPERDRSAEPEPDPEPEPEPGREVEPDAEAEPHPEPEPEPGRAVEPDPEPEPDAEPGREGEAAPDHEQGQHLDRARDFERAQDRKAGSERAPERAGAPSPDASPDASPGRSGASPGETAPQTGPLTGSGDFSTGPGGSGSGAGAGSGAKRRSRRRVGLELRVRLSTLLGLDRHPAEIAGWGYTHAEHARAIVRRHPTASWRYAVCDEHGVLLHNGLITARPTTKPGARPGSGPGSGDDTDPITDPGDVPATGATRAVIEIQIPLTLLHHLHHHPDERPAWAAVIAQIIGDTTTGLPGQHPPPTAAEADDAGHGQAHACDEAPPPDSGHRHAPGDRHRDRRFPSAPMRRRVQTRDRTCAFPGCRMPAKDTDTDHVSQWTTGGRTQDHNLISLCRHDHLLKDHHGWKLTVKPDGTLDWTSPLGLTHTTRRPAVIISLPAPIPRSLVPRPAGRSPDPPDDQEQPIWDDLRPPPDEGPGEPKSEPGDEGPPPLSADEPVPF